MAATRGSKNNLIHRVLSPFLTPFRKDANYKRLAIVGFALFVLNHLLRSSIQRSDDMVWYPLTTDFFGQVGDNIGKHRPLFGFFAFLIHVFVRNFDHSWLILNAASYLALGLFAYAFMLRVCQDRAAAFVFALFPLTSAQVVLWLNHSLINVQGFLITYFSGWMLMKYLQTSDLREKKKLLWVFSLSFGVAMLGKAQYNILLAVIVSAVLIDRRYLRDAIGFTVIQLLPLGLWVGFLKFALGASYAVYEVERKGYRLSEVILGQVMGAGVGTYLADSIFGGLATIYNGLGVVLVLAIPLTIGAFIRERQGAFMLLFYLGTTFFLSLVNFNYSRHAGDYAPIGYYGLALGLVYLYRKFALKRPVLWWSAASVASGIWLYLNFSNYFMSAIVG